MAEASKWKLLPGWKKLRDYQLNQPRRKLEGTYGYSLMTPFEGRMIGGTPHNHNYLSKRGNTIEDMHTPIAVLGDGKSPENASIVEANLLRGKVQFNALSAFSLGYLYDIKGKRMKEDPDLDMSSFIAVSLEPLDPKTGITVRDPRILGVYDKETDTVRQIPGRDLNKEYYRHLKTWTEVPRESDNPQPWDYVRDGKSYLETESSGDPEKG